MLLVKTTKGLFFSLLLTTSVANAQITDIKEIRNLFYKAHDNKEYAVALWEKVANATKDYPLLLGYKGIADMMMGYHAANPYAKLKYFRNGKEQLDNAIHANKNDTELRYLRFAAQSNTPGILMYNNNMKEDKTILVSYLLAPANKRRDEDLYRRISSFMVASGECTAEEKSKIRNLAH